MERKRISPEAPALQDVLDALDDQDCRTILRLLEEPLTVNELTERCDIPQSTMYRKLDLLSDASLVEEKLEVRPDGRHTRRYVVNFDEVRLSLTEDRSLDVEISREHSRPEERLSALWSEVRKET
ncbi:MAG: helix-turn-helix domain-containing protein [Halolamina sp.]|uniref:helix-turn-helix domain-containing protein n=1 Tax=Halolamina sp. TaxID=1940283 RepID=UPI002FC372A2